jgi:hypothetical protein
MLTEKIFSIRSEDEFNRIALETYRYQSQHNPVYRRFLNALGRHGMVPSHYSRIPGLPAEFFKNHRILSGDAEPVLCFASSGTTGSERSRHYVTDAQLYETSFLNGFNYFYGNPAEWHILAMLPAYANRPDSSLIYMVNGLMNKSRSPHNGFFQEANGFLIENLLKASRDKSRKTLLLGVSFALMDLAEKHPACLEDVVVMETGGMKGRRAEPTREELHEILCRAFCLPCIHSEYGMTELLSQAYSRGHGIFKTPPWMKVYVIEPEDPLAVCAPGKTGLISIVDLVNYHSCAFIATRDMGRLHPDGSFEVLGRHDHSEVRGCNLMLIQ